MHGLGPVTVPNVHTPFPQWIPWLGAGLLCTVHVCTAARAAIPRARDARLCTYARARRARTRAPPACWDGIGCSTPCADISHQMAPPALLPLVLLPSKSFSSPTRGGNRPYSGSERLPFARTVSCNT